MREIIVIGGGLTGLAAAWELSRLHMPYTLIEVKKRMGGSLKSVERDGFIFDSAPLCYARDGAWDFLDELGLMESVTPVGCHAGRESVLFTTGTGTLVDALAAQVTGDVMQRMAVSTLGATDKGFAICMENGLMLEARGLIVAAPARHAERMFHTLVPEISERLLDYEYANRVRVSFGFRREAVGTLPALDDLSAAPFLWTDQPQRVPEGCVLVQVSTSVGVRRVLPQQDGISIQNASAILQQHWGFIPESILAYSGYWPESDPLTCYTVAHAAHMDTIDAHLPEGIALVGSDYRAVTLGERVAHGRAAARQVAAIVGK